MTKTNYRVHRFCLICGLVLVSATSATAQLLLPHGNAQRSRVFATQSADAPPTRLLWKLERLFRLKFSEPYTLQNGPLTLRGDLPTFYYYTAPIVSDGILYFTIYQGDAYFYAVDVATGKQLLTLKFDGNELSLPVAMGKTAIIGTAAGNLYAYDVLTQTKKWVFDQGGSFNKAEPVIQDGIVYVCSYGGLFALAADTGALRWSFMSEKWLAGPAVQGEEVIVLTEKTLIAIDKKTGTKKWETSVGRDFSGPSILDDQVFIRHADGELRAYALQDGTLRWKAKREGGAETVIALFAGAVIYGEQYGNLVALDAKTGAEKWRFKTKKFCHAPLVAGGTVYAQCDDKRLYALDPGTGALKWSFDTKGTGQTPTIANGVLFFLGSNGLLQAIQ